VRPAARCGAAACGLGAARPGGRGGRARRVGGAHGADGRRRRAARRDDLRPDRRRPPRDGRRDPGAPGRPGRRLHGGGRRAVHGPIRAGPPRHPERLKGGGSMPRLRRSLTVLVLAALPALALPLLAAAQEKVTLKFLSVAPGEPRRQAVLLVVERYEKANPNVKVELTEVPFDQYFQKLSVAFAAGTGVDVFDVDSPLVASYGHQDVLLPLDEYVDRKDWEDFLDQERQIATYNGKILTMPWSSSSQAVFYNIDMLKEAGIAPPTSPDQRWTWAQLLEAARKLTRKAPDGTTQVWGLVVEQPDRPYQILPLLQSNGAQVLSPDGSKTTGFLNSPE